MMGSEAHRNLILGDYTHIGIGVINRPPDSTTGREVYWTIMVVSWIPPMTASELRSHEMRVFELTNAERVKHGLPPFIWHETLAEAGRAHIADLLQNAIRGHAGSDGSNVLERIRRAEKSDARYSYAGENLNYNQRSPESTVTSWMNSSGHRANILNARFTHMGVGFIQRPEGSSSGNTANYTVQVFSELRQ